jgi:hypothetical protein
VTREPASKWDGFDSWQNERTATMEPARHSIPQLDDAPPPIVPETGAAGPSPETVQSGAPGPASTAAVLDTPHESNRYNAPAHSPERSPSDMLPPSAEEPEAPGGTGLASVIPSQAATHRISPIDQSPEPSEHFFPPVPDDRKIR